jgi:Ca-activated chloride channel family protein
MGWRVWLIHAPFVLRSLLVILLSIALARPQMSNRLQSESTEGIDIMMALDVSGTMLGEDFRPNRLEAAKAVAKEFVSSRPNDQIGLVLFAGESFTQCPLTADHTVLFDLFESVKFGMIEDGTAIGLGLANAVNRMKDSPTKSKVIILLTDGSNNRGDIDPQTAAEIAKTYGIRVYAIGVGSYSKEVKVPVYTPYGVQYGTMSSEFDESTLRNIAQLTGGEYFRAKDNKTLRAIYDQIDQLEKTKIRVREYSKRTEHFMPFLLAAFACLLLDLVLRHFVLRTVAE